MPVFESPYNLASLDYVRDTEHILRALVRSEHRIARATLHGKPVFIIADMALAKRIFEDGKNFSFTPNDLTSDEPLTDGAKAFVDEGLESPLLASTYDAYKDSRKLFNQVFKRAYTDRADAFDQRATQHLRTLLHALDPAAIDVVALSQRYSLPLIAHIIGLDALSYDELQTLAACSRVMVEGNGLQGDCAAVSRLALARDSIGELIGGVVAKGAAPENSALACLLELMDAATAIGFARTFVLGGLDTGSSSLVFAIYQLAAQPQQRERFLAMEAIAQREALTELVAKEAPAYYSPRFAVRDIVIDDVEIPAGSFVQLAMYALNACANPDFDITRHDKARCPLHNNESLPFGHARHKCPGEALARHMSAIFLRGFFSRFDVEAIAAVSKEHNTFSRRLSELILCARLRRQSY